MDLPVWAPNVIQDLNDSELGLYLEFSCTACIPGGGCNVEKALQVLYQSDGDIKSAMERLLTDKNESLANRDHAIWTENEVHMFERLIMLYGKQFDKISHDIRTKTVKDCVQFYYLWKKSPIRNSTPPMSTPSPVNTTPQENNEKFPCKVCGRVFDKIKSRSAHMKRHKNER